MALLILMRHGQSMWNAANLFTGWVDVPLTNKGIEEAIAGGKEISSLPIVLGDYSENGEKIDIEAFNLNGGTRKVNAIFEALGLGDDLRRARNGRKIRAGKATMRGRVHKTPKSILLVVANKDGLAKAARNLPGVDVVAAKDLSAEHLAPGGDLGRLTVFTKTAVEALS